MNYEQAAQHVGDRVIYSRPGGLGEPERRSPGVIEAMKQLPLVRFDDGSLLQVSPYCLELEPQEDLFSC